MDHGDQSKDDPQIIAKKAVRKLGLQLHFCFHCMMIDCYPGSSVNNWILTGCGCCRLGHDILEH